jgi:hypothetical protein
VKDSLKHLRDWFSAEAWPPKPPAKAVPKQAEKEEGDRLSISVRRRGVEVRMKTSGESGSGSGGGAGGGGSGGGNTGANGKDESPGGGVGAVVLKVVGAVAAAIGVTGAVTLVGASVFWIRFYEAGLPATQAISAISKQEQLVEGSQEVITFVLIALAATLLIFFADPKGRIRRITVAALALLGGGAILYILLTKLGWGGKLSLVALVVALTVGSAVVGRRTGPHFWPLAAAVFLSALIFSGACGLLIVQQQKFVQGVAILRGPTDQGLTGIYVAATDDTLYFGKHTPIRKADGIDEANGLYEVHRGDELTYSVGPLESEGEAESRTNALLAQLIENRSLNPPPAQPEEEGKSKGGVKKGAKGAGASPASASPRSPLPVDAKVLEAFAESPTVRDEVTGSSLCLARYSEYGSGLLVGQWWTSCEEADAQRTMLAARDALALPARYQPVYDEQTRITLPVGTELFFLEGTAAEQCEHKPGPSCGHLYQGGGKQYFLLDPSVAIAKSSQPPEVLCTDARQDRASNWRKPPCSP